MTRLATFFRGAWPPLLRCITLATSAALFGLNSILIRTIGHIVKAGSTGAVAGGGLTLWAALGCAVMAASGVLLLSRDYPIANQPTRVGELET
jgi:hypothetical protein